MTQDQTAIAEAPTNAGTRLQATTPHVGTITAHARATPGQRQTAAGVLRP